MDFYQLLGVNRNASKDEIKKAYRRMALKYHPDKNKDIDACEQFHQLQMAQQILMDDVKKRQYDELSSQDKLSIINCIKTIIQDVMKPDNISKIIVDEQIKGFILRGEYKYLKDYIFQKINQHYMKTDGDDIFIASKCNNGSQDEEKQYHIMENDSGYESSCIASCMTATHTSERNLHLTIHTTLEEVWMNKVKEITVLRHVIDDPRVFHASKTKEHKLYVPLIDDKLVFKGEGDEYIDRDGKVSRSDIIIKIKCKKHHFIQRVNDYDLLLYLPVSLYELFYGFRKTFNYFGNKKICIASRNPLQEHKFDGEKLIIEMESLGLASSPDERGRLHVHMLLNKGGPFRDNLKTYFSDK